MVTMKLIIDDELQALLLLSSLLDSWETLVVSLSNSALNGVLQLAMVKNSLLNEETKRKDMGKDITQALVTENRGRSKSTSSKGRDKSRSRSESKGKFKCFYCDKEGYIKRNCKAWKNKQKGDKNKKMVDDENTAVVIVLEDEVLAIGQDDYCTVSYSYVEWVIDSAASCHVTPRKELFTSYKAGKFGRVKMDNDSYADIVGISDICVRANTGYTLILKDVRHVLDIHLNLISTHVLDKEGYGNYFRDGKWTLSKGSLLFARGKICCILYKTQVKLCKNVVSAA